MTLGKRVNAFTFGLAGLIGVSGLVPIGRAAEQQEKTKLDCGVNALFVLLRLEGRPVPYDRLESTLPPRNPDGYSMAEVSAAARSLGLPLDGVKFVKGDKPLDRPAIAFFQNARGGHFAVLRPVGTTGTMVQVIDRPHVPAIMDYDRILGSKGWTGRILLPSPPWYRRRATLPAVAGVCLLFLALAFTRWRRSPGAKAREVARPV